MQALLAQGYAVLMPNVHRRTGYCRSAPRALLAGEGLGLKQALQLKGSMRGNERNVDAVGLIPLVPDR